MSVKKHYQAKVLMPFGVLGISCTAEALTGIDFLPRQTTGQVAENSLAAEVVRQLQSYAMQPDYHFNLPLNTQGTAFQQRVWEVMRNIPRGNTLTYGEVAMQLKSAARAVGQACGANPIPIVIPCHRIVSKQGLGGFAHHDRGGMLEIKRWLLAHEQAL